MKKLTVPRRLHPHRAADRRGDHRHHRGDRGSGPALRARMAGNEASAIGSLRAINSGQAAYSSSCASGGYAQCLDDLVKPPAGGGRASSAPISTRTTTVKSGYIVNLAKDHAAPAPSSATADTCNGTPGRRRHYFAKADPVTLNGTGTRYFATDMRGTIFQIRRHRSTCEAAGHGRTVAGSVTGVRSARRGGHWLALKPLGAAYPVPLDADPRPSYNTPIP